MNLTSKMKSKRLPFVGLLTLILFVLAGCSQKDYPGRYYYSFKNKKLFEKIKQKDSVDSVKIEIKSPIASPSGKDIQIEVTDFNPLTTEVLILDSASKFFFSDTAKLSQALAGKIGSKPVATTTPPAGTAAVADTTSKSDNCEKLNDFTEDYNEKKEEIQKQMDILTKMVPLFDGIKDSYNDLAKQSSINRASAIKSVRDYFLVSFNAFLEANELTAVGDDPLKVSMADLQGSINNVLRKIDAERLKENQKIIAALDLKKCSKQKDQLLKSMAEIVTAIEEYRKAFETKTLPEIKTRLVIYGSIEFYFRNDPFFISRHITIESDEHNVKINAKNIAQNTITNWDIIRVLPNRGFKLDVAAGFFISGLHDENYSRQSKDSIFSTKYVAPGGVVRDTTKLQSFNGFFKQDQKNLSFGASVYLHAHTQTSKLFNWGMSLGFGGLFNDQARMVFSFGPTLIIGRKNRFIISPGIAVAQTDRLSRPYRDGVWYEKTIDNVPYFKAWKADWSLAFSWNL